MQARSKKDLMAAVAAANVNSIPVSPSDTPKAFIEAASKWLGNWWRIRPAWRRVSPGFCAIVLDPDFASNPACKDFVPLRMFRDAPAKTLGGAIHVTDGVLAKVYRKQGDFGDANALIAELETTGIADRPMVLFEPEVGIIFLAENGIKAPYIRMPPLGVFHAELTVANVDRLLTELYVTTLKYPTTFPQVWFKPDNFIPIFEAEKIFQGIVLIHLRASAQDTWVVRPEDYNNAGRTDLSLSTTSPQRTFVLEIKVLKSFRYNPKGYRLTYDEARNIAWANGGIDQVIEYRAAQQAAEAFLLLYDLRKHDADIESVVKRCKRENVNQRRYFIFNASAARIRAALKKKS
jgi:hypothetical protein